MAGGRRWRFVAYVMATLPLLQGCTVNADEHRTGTQTYIGIVRIRHPAIGNGLVATDISNLGIGIDHGAYLGWRQSRLVFVKPDECRVVLILRDRLDADHIETLLKAMGDKPCIADYSGSLRPR